MCLPSSLVSHCISGDVEPPLWPSPHSRKRQRHLASPPVSCSHLRAAIGPTTCASFALKDTLLHLATPLPRIVM